MVICFHCFRDYYSLICPLETIKFVGMRRQSIFIVFETTTVSFTFPRQSNPLACGDNHGHPLSLFSRLLQSHLPSRDNQVRWHVETIIVIRFHFFETITVSFAFQRQSSSLACGDNHGHPILLFLRLLQSPLPSKDNQFHWHVETIMVIHFHCFQDYYNLLCLPEAIKNIGMQRQPYLLLFIFSKTIKVFFRDFDVSLTLQDFKVFC